MSKRLVFSVFFLMLAAAPIFSTETPLSRVAFGSCLRQNRPQPVWAGLRKSAPDLFVFMGDTVYADTQNPSLVRAAYEELSANESFTAFRATTPIIGTWDDHDYGKENAGVDFPIKEESQTAFLDFYKVPEDSPRRQQKGVYQSIIYGPPGKRVQVILLDTRFFRSPLRFDDRKLLPPRPYLPNTDLNATLLGRAQWNWLRDELRKPAELRLLVSSIQVLATEHSKEKWANFPLERQKLFETLKNAKAQGLLILSGDRYFAEISRDDIGLGYPLYDITASSLNSARPAEPAEKNSRRVGHVYAGENFGLLEIDWDSAVPRVSVEIRDEDGHIRVQQDILLSELRASP